MLFLSAGQCGEYAVINKLLSAALREAPAAKADLISPSIHSRGKYAVNKVLSSLEIPIFSKESLTCMLVLWTGCLMN